MLRTVPVLLFMAAAAGALELPAPILHLPFDGSADATIAGGTRTPLRPGTFAWAEGVRGKALDCTPGTVLEYAEPGNLTKERGSVTMWFSPHWSPYAQPGAGAAVGGDWRCLLSEPGLNQVGSGSLWLWFQGPVLRGDARNKTDNYSTVPIHGMIKDSWAHVAFTWDADDGIWLYLNGAPIRRLDDGYTLLRTLLVTGKNDFTALRRTNPSFFIGSQEGTNQADGRIDEFRSYDRVLTQEQVDADMALACPLRIDCLTRAFIEGAEAKLRWKVRNLTGKPSSGNASWRVVDEAGTQVAAGNGAMALKPGETRAFDLKLPALRQGRHAFWFTSDGAPAQAVDVWVMGKANAYAAPAGKLQTEPVEEIDFAKGVATERFAVLGETRTGTLAGRSYLEGGLVKNDRFAVHITLPEANIPYLIEWEYPDDKVRTMELVMQEAKNPSSGLQTGVFCGDEYPNAMGFRTHRAVLWARSADIAAIFMTNRDNAPVAVSTLRISRINGGLPDAGVRPAAPVDGRTRSVGLYFEDPVLNINVGTPDGQYMPRFEQGIDRLVAYMKWSGQDILCYPGVWYQGRMGATYQARPHDIDFTGQILAKFAANGLGYMPTMNVHNVPIDPGLRLDRAALADGSLHSTPFTIFNTGKAGPGGFHGSPTDFNPLHPATQRYFESEIDDMLDRYGDSPAFKGVVLHLTNHSLGTFGGIETGYNDYCIDAFEKATGTKIPVDRADPLRGKLYFDWLMANAREKWIAWRCAALAEWYKRLAARMTARRADLRLSLVNYNPTASDQADDARIDDPDYVSVRSRETGIDGSLFANTPSIIVSQTIYPSDYRHFFNWGKWWREPGKAKAISMARNSHTRPDTYALLGKASTPWINMHDRYFEDGVGNPSAGPTWWGAGRPFKDVPWLKETHWRVSDLIPSGDNFLEHYLLPLRFADVQGFTKGGFLIGTVGGEGPLAAFARAFRALPAVKFTDVAGSSDVVKVRLYKDKTALWIYAANTGREKAVVEIPVANLTDLSDGKAVGKTTRIELAPLQLRSFRAVPTAELKAVTCLKP